MTPISVLVVDDEPDIRDLVVLLLQLDPRCAAVTAAGGVDEALHVIRRVPPDVVLIDFFLGRHVCVDILPDVRAMLPQAHVVVYTASSRAARAAGVLEAGADRIIEKGAEPIDAVLDAVLTAAVGDAAS